MTGQMTGQTTLLACGLVCADITFRVAEMPRRAEKYRADDVRFSLGGGGAIAAVAMQRLGARVQLAGRLGDDLFGDLLRSEIGRRALGDDLLVCFPDSKSPISSVFVDDDGERQIVNYRKVDSEVDTATDENEPPASGDVLAVSSVVEVLDAERLQSLDRPGAILVDTRWEAAAVQVLAYARQEGITAVIDGEAPVCRAAMALATHIAFSRQGLRDYAAVDDVQTGLRKAAEEFACWVCVTDGEEGVYHWQDGRVVHTPAFSIRAVDSLGAGDVWHAAFALRLAQGQDEQSAIVFASAAAALKCTSAAGLDGIPTFSQVMAFLEERGAVGAL